MTIGGTQTRWPKPILSRACERKTGEVQGFKLADDKPVFKLLESLKCLLSLFSSVLLNNNVFISAHTYLNPLHYLLDLHRLIMYFNELISDHGGSKSPSWLLRYHCQLYEYYVDHRSALQYNLLYKRVDACSSQAEILALLIGILRMSSISNRICFFHPRPLMDTPSLDILSTWAYVWKRKVTHSIVKPHIWLRLADANALTKSLLSSITN